MTGFRDIWMPYAERFYRAAFYMLESQQDAEDAVQELFLKLWTGRSGLDEVRNPAAYGMALLKNICLDRIRRREIRRHEFPDVGIPADDPPPESSLAAKDLLTKVLEEMDKLPDRQAEVMKLMVLDGLEYKEISRRTGISQVHVRVLVSTARKTLRQKLRI